VRLGKTIAIEGSLSMAAEFWFGLVVGLGLGSGAMVLAI
jgi:hypothetical protein